MATSKSLWIWGTVLAGLVLIGLSVFWGPKATVTAPPAVLARVEKLTGLASIVRAGGLTRENLDRRASLSPLDTLETGDLGEVRLDFESGDRVRLRENSRVTLEKVEDQQSSHVVLILKQGSLQVESAGREGQLFIGKNGERILAADYQESPLATAAVTEVATPTPARTEVSTSLTEAEIQEVMNSHRTSFLKCYTQLLQKDPNAKGEASLSFTVENNGKVSGSEVTSKTLNAADFQRCLKDVVGRIEFRSSQGPPVSTLFPLRFE